MEVDWSLLPDPLLVNVFSFLNARDLTLSGMVCSRWRSISLSRGLWRRLLQISYKICSFSEEQRPSYKEYRRLARLGKARHVEVIEEHADEVWHVVFSHDGTMLAAGGKEGHLIVWDASNVDRLKIQWQLNAREPPVEGLELMYIEFSPNDCFILASVSVSRQNHVASAFICNSKSGNVLCVVKDVFLDVFATWFNNSWIVTAYFRDILGGSFTITVLDVGNLEKRTCINQSVHTYQQKVGVVGFSFYSHNVAQVQHCRIIHPRQRQSILFCQLHMDDVDQFASVEISIDAIGKPSTRRKCTDVMENPRRQFDYIVPLDGHSHACGVVLSPDETKIIASSIVAERCDSVRLCIYDAITLQLLHTLPSDNMACPSCNYYQFPSITEEVIACGSDSGTIHIWDQMNSIEIGQLHGHREICNAVAFCPGRPYVMASASDDHTVRIWCFQQ